MTQCDAEAALYVLRGDVNLREDVAGEWGGAAACAAPGEQHTHRLETGQEVPAVVSTNTKADVVWGATVGGKVPRGQDETGHDEGPQTVPHLAGHLLDELASLLVAFVLPRSILECAPHGPDERDGFRAGSDAREWLDRPTPPATPGSRPPC